MDSRSAEIPVSETGILWNSQCWYPIANVYPNSTHPQIRPKYFEDFPWLLRFPMSPLLPRGIHVNLGTIQDLLHEHCEIHTRLAIYRFAATGGWKKIGYQRLLYIVCFADHNSP